MEGDAEIYNEDKAPKVKGPDELFTTQNQKIHLHHENQFSNDDNSSYEDDDDRTDEENYVFFVDWDKQQDDKQELGQNDDSQHRQYNDEDDWETGVEGENENEDEFGYNHAQKNWHSADQEDRKPPLAPNASMKSAMTGNYQRLSTFYSTMPAIYPQELLEVKTPAVCGKKYVSGPYASWSSKPPSIKYKYYGYTVSKNAPQHWGGAMELVTADNESGEEGGEEGDLHLQHSKSNHRSRLRYPLATGIVFQGGDFRGSSPSLLTMRNVRFSRRWPFKLQVQPREHKLGWLMWFPNIRQGILTGISLFEKSTRVGHDGENGFAIARAGDQAANGISESV